MFVVRIRFRFFCSRAKKKKLNQVTGSKMFVLNNHE